MAAEMTPEQRILRSRLGAYALHAKYDARDTTRKARQTFLARFEKEVDPDGVLEPADRARRAEAAKKAYYTALALKSSLARKRRKT